MEKFYDYLSKKINLLFEDIKTDSYKLNQFFMLKDLKTKDELKKILEDNQNLTLFTKIEFDVFKKHRRNLLDKHIKEFNFEDTGFLYLLKGTTEKINEKYVIEIKAKEDKITYSFEQSYIKSDNGIVFLKEKKGFDKTKKFNNLEEFKNELIEEFKDNSTKTLTNIVKNPNIALYVKQVDQNKIKIICYDYAYFNEFFKENNDFIFPILFQGQISNNKDTKDPSFQKIPYDGAVINWTVARKDISGRNILYPLLAYYANNNVLIADRDSLSKFAKKVWDNFYINKDIFSEKMPIDNYDSPITLYKTEDDGRLYSETPPIKIDYKKIKEMDKKEQEEELIRIRQDDPYNWAYKLNNSVKSNTKTVIKQLEKNHEKIASKESIDFLKKLELLSNDFFDKNVR
jgi:hypothetical protein